MHKVEGPLRWDPKVTPDGLRLPQVKMYLHPHSVLPAIVCSGSACTRSAAGIESCLPWGQHVLPGCLFTASPRQMQPPGCSMTPTRAGCLCTAPCASSLPWAGGKYLSRTKPRILIITFPGTWAHLSLPLPLPLRPLKVPLLWHQSLLTSGVSLVGPWLADGQWWPRLYCRSCSLTSAGGFTVRLEHDKGNLGRCRDNFHGLPLSICSLQPSELLEFNALYMDFF